MKVKAEAATMVVVAMAEVAGEEPEGRPDATTKGRPGYGRHSDGEREVSKITQCLLREEVEIKQAAASASHPSLDQRPGSRRAH